MNDYGNFAYIYDKLVTDVDYNSIINFIKKTFEKNNLSPKLIVDLACGTGNIAIPLSQSGYEMIGIDSSTDMLSVAKEKAEKLGHDILFLNQDITNFELYGTVDAATCILDSINHITDKRNLLRFFKLVKNYLNIGGIFIFDINTEYKLEEVIGNNIFIRDENEIYYIWENNYRRSTKICDFYLTFFVKTGESYKKFEEIHREKAYTIKELKNMISLSGLELLSISDELTFEKPKAKSKRLFFVCKRNS